MQRFLMVIDERHVRDAALDPTLRAEDIGWFAAKQPALILFFEERFGEDLDALALALELSWRSAAAFETQWGTRLVPVGRALLDRCEEDILDEASGRHSLAMGCAFRQPELCRWLETILSGVRFPFDAQAREKIGLMVATTIAAFDVSQASQASVTGTGQELGVLLK